jgi:hypothetical protein
LGVAALSTFLIINGYYALKLSGFAPQDTIPTVSFVGNYGLVHNRNTALGQNPYEYGDEYSTFYVCTQRLGYFPVWHNSEPLYDDRATAAILVNPHVLREQRYADALQQYVGKGTNVLILAAPEERDDMIYVIENELNGIAQPMYTSIQYCDAWQCSSGSQVMLYSDRHALSRECMGPVEGKPNSEERAASYQLAFELIGMLRDDSPSR